MSHEETKRFKVSFILCLIISALTLAVYWQVQEHEFLNHDDPVYITENPWVQNGLTWEGVKWAFTTRYANFWHPLTWLSLMLDCQLFGLDAGMHHWMAVLIHLANTLLLFLALRSMTGAIWRSAFVAGFFALHPLHVESVAWAAERKDVLSALFWMAAMWAYAGYARCPTWRRYSGMFVLFVLGLMAKPMLVTLPFVLLLLDYWPLGRMPFPWIDWRPAGIVPATGRRLIFEKLAMLVPSVAFSAITYFSEDVAVVSFKLIPLYQRLFNGLVSYVTYIRKMFFPVDLGMRYPILPVPAGRAAFCGALLILISVCILRVARRRPSWMVGWLWYLGVMVPVIGLIQIGAVSGADRFTYIPLIGLFIGLVWGGGDLLQPWCRPSVLVAAGFSILLVYAAMTAEQIGYWHDNIQLYRHTLKVAYFNPLIHNNIGNCYERDGRLKQAEYAYRQALALNPNYATAHFNLGNVLVKENKPEDAALHYRIAIKQSPDSFEMHNNYAILLVHQKQIAEAWKEYKTTIRLNPNNAGIRTNYAVLLTEAGHLDEAAAQLRECVRINPKNTYTEFLLAKVLQTAGHPDEAVLHYEHVLKLDPESYTAHFELAQTLYSQRKYREAVVHYREALRLKPGSPAVLNTLAWILSTSPDEAIRNGAEAVKFAQITCERTNFKSAYEMDILSAAQAETGEFAEAIKTAEQAQTLSISGKQEDLAAKIANHLELYKRRQPVRETL